MGSNAIRSACKHVATAGRKVAPSVNCESLSSLWIRLVLFYLCVTVSGQPFLRHGPRQGSTAWHRIEHVIRKIVPAGKLSSIMIITGPATPMHIITGALKMPTDVLMIWL